MEYQETHIPGAVLIKPVRRLDRRGSFREVFNEDRLRDIGLPPVAFRQMNVSESRKGVLRGLHFQKLRPQAKLVTVLRGVAVDVVADIRRDSQAFGRYAKATLSAENGHALFIPAGCAHGFVSLTDDLLFCYLCDDTYSGPDDQGGIRWDDPFFSIYWPCTNPLVSEKDALLPWTANLRPEDYPFTASR